MFQTILSAAALVFVVALTCVALIRKERYLSDYFLVALFVAAGVLELCDLMSLSAPLEALFWKRLVMIGESLLPSLGLVYSLTHGRDLSVRSVPLLQKGMVLVALLFPIAVLAAPIDRFFYSPDFGVERILFLGNVGFAFYIALLVSVIVALYNLESTYLSAPLASRWKIKFETIGAGFFFVVLIFYYSKGLLYRTIDMNLLPVRSLALLLGALLIIYSKLARGSGEKIRVSGNMVYKSLVLLVVGLYLLGLGLVGEGLKHFGESFQRSMIIGIALVAGIGLLLILLSETVKRRIRVFLHKNFYQHKYDYRTQWLQFTARLSASKSRAQLLRSIVSGFCEIFGMSGGALFLKDENSDEHRFHLEMTYEMEDEGLRITEDDPVIRLMAEKGWVVNLSQDMSNTDLGMSDILRIDAAAFVIPLFLDDVLDGFIVLSEPINPDETYHYEDYDLMKTLAMQALSAIQNLRLSDELSSAREMAAMGRVSAFVAHDLKNLVYTISLMLDNARDYIDNPEFQKDMLESLTNSVTRMNGLIARLKSLPEKTVLQKGKADLLKIVQDAAGLVAGGAVEVGGTQIITDVDAEEMEKVVLNLVVNAMDATGDKGPVSIMVGADEDAWIRVADQGCGMPVEFIEHQLFQPFRTTKKKGLGIGLYQCRQIVKAHGGRIEVHSEVGKGSVFTVHLPLTKEA
ncbi:MAG: PEP-CTERM system histidine kinase PrsK [Nitrospirota bacterium]|nr:PEP-CTERM system histidine kinase PrsK [Nitrospirota bacterium]